MTVQHFLVFFKGPASENLSKIVPEGPWAPLEDLKADLDGQKVGLGGHKADLGSQKICPDGHQTAWAAHKASGTQRNPRKPLQVRSKKLSIGSNMD